jgi:phosphate transport system substrate-binding protein
MNFVLRACALVLMLCVFAGAPAQTTEKKATAVAAKKAGPKAKAAPSPPLTSLTWRGDHCTARAFMKDLAKDYETSKQGRFALTPFSTISGLDAVNDGSADLAGSARPPMPDRAEEKSTNFYPVAWDGLVMITSPKNPVGEVSLKQLHDIYLGRITDWSELGGPAGPINLYAVAGPLDGNEYSLRVLLFHHGDQDVAVPRLYVNVEMLEEGIAIDPHGLGLTTFSAARANPALKMLAVEGISASSVSIADGSYPLYSTLFLAAREDSAKRADIEKFVQFAGSEPALAVLRRHGLVPYADAPDLPGKQAERMAYIDARVRPELATVSVVGTAGTPVSAPVATADYLTRTAPNAATTQEAKDRAARATAERKNAEASAGH